MVKILVLGHIYELKIAEAGGVVGAIPYESMGLLA